MPVMVETKQKVLSTTTVDNPNKEKIIYVAVKRLFDILASLFGLLVTLPIALPVAIAIKAHAGGKNVWLAHGRLSA